MPLGPPEVLATFILFCRIGTCLMLMPGFSTPRIPPRIRLFLALGITLVLAPLLLPEVRDSVTGVSTEALAVLIVSEIMIGAAIGILGQLFFTALETLGTAATMAIGFGPLHRGHRFRAAAGARLTADDVGRRSSFVTGQYWEVLRALSDSYAAMPVAQLFSAQIALSRLTACWLTHSCSRSGSPAPSSSTQSS